MSYGNHLAAAAAALAQAHAALRDPPPQPRQRVAAALARAGIYRSLEQHTVVLGGVPPAELPPLGEIPTPAQWHVTHHPPATNLAISLRQASAGTVAVSTPALGPIRVTKLVASALSSAQSHLQAAGDIVSSNIGRRDGPAATRRPHTTEGMALLVGVGRRDNLALVARLAAATVDLDTRLVRWLWPEDAPPSMQPLLAAAEQDAWRTKSGSLRDSATIVAARGTPARAPLRDVAPAPSVDDPGRWVTVTSQDDCATALDAARSWLVRNGQQITIGQLRSITHAAASLTTLASYIHLHAGVADMPEPSTATVELVLSATRSWRGAAQAAGELRSPVLPHVDHTTATVALTSAAVWLQQQLRSTQGWRNPAPWVNDPARWRSAGRRILAGLPDLADLLGGALTHAQAQQMVLAATQDLTRAGQLVQRIRWQPALPDNRYYRRVRAALQNAATRTRRLGDTAGISRRPGLAAAATARTRGDPHAAHLAQQWYRGPKLSEPTLPGPRPAARAPIDPTRRRRSPRL